MEDAQDQTIVTFSQKGNCQDCRYYTDCPRMKDGERCYSSSRTVYRFDLKTGIIEEVEST